MIRPGREARRAAGRLCLIDFSGREPSARLERAITEDHIAGVVLFKKNVTSPPQVAHLTSRLQRIASDGGRPPVWITIDHEGGSVNRFLPLPSLPGAFAVTPLPSAMAIGAAGDPVLAEAAGQIAGRELSAMGIHLNFAPVLDVNTNPANPVIGTRAFGAFLSLVQEMGLAYIKGLQAAGVGATAKHFPGHGNVAVDSHLALPLVDRPRRALEGEELPPFGAAARAGVAAVMTAHVAYPALDPSGTPATLSRPILTGLLRTRWRYQGLIVSDSLSMKAVLDRHAPGEAAVEAIRAGCDMLLALGEEALQEEVLGALARAIDRGDLPASRVRASLKRIDDAARRWRPEARARTQPPGVVDLVETVGTAAHETLARRIAAAAVTVVRDVPGTIPLGADRVLIAEVPPAPGDRKTLRFATVLRRYLPHARPIDLRDDPSKASVVAVTCSRGSLAPRSVHALRRLHKRAGDRLVVVATGDPYDLLQVPDVPAYVATYGSDEYSLDAVAQVLAGRLRPQGRLPVMLPTISTST